MEERVQDVKQECAVHNIALATRTISRNGPMFVSEGWQPEAVLGLSSSKTRMQEVARFNTKTQPRCSAAIYFTQCILYTRAKMYSSRPCGLVKETEGADRLMLFPGKRGHYCRAKQATAGKRGTRPCCILASADLWLDITLHPCYMSHSWLLTKSMMFSQATGRSQKMEEKKSVNCWSCHCRHSTTTIKKYPDSGIDKVERKVHLRIDVHKAACPANIYNSCQKRQAAQN